MSKRLFIFIALYAEAKPLIRRLQMKREKFSCGFDVYADPAAEIYLLLTGSGSIAAATAVGSCMSYYGAGSEDVLINIGTCAGQYETGKIFLCNRIREQVSGRTFYPDICYRHDFREAELITLPRVLEQGTLSAEDFRESGDGDLGEDLSGKPEKIQLYDMEAAAIYQAASYYLGPHQMCFLKIISDAGAEKGTVTAEMLSDLMERNADRILGQIDWLKQMDWTGQAAIGDSGIAEAGDAELQPSIETDMELPLVLVSQWQEDCERLCGELHCSQTMRAAVEQCVRYWILAGVNYQKALEQMRADGLLPCRDKREGKQRFEELRKQLL